MAGRNEAGSGDEAVVEVLAADGTKLTVRVKAAHWKLYALVNAGRRGGT